MSITIGSSTDAVLANIETPHALKTAKLAQSQQEIEAQMALQLIQSASIQVPSGKSGNHINIKV